MPTFKQVLRAESLEKSYKSKKVVNQVSFEVHSGQTVGILGPNGAGKTTSFYMVIGLIRCDAGDIFLNNTKITNWAMHKRARSGIAYLPQEPSVFRRLTVEENLLVVLETQALSDSARKEELKILLEEFNLMSVAKQKSFTLSGGERRRVEVARALAMKPHFILLDEPFAGIDPIAVADIQNMIKGLKKRGIGILITDHNVRETLAICDLGYLLNDGKMIIKGTPEEIASSKIAREAYLGMDFQI